MTLKLEVTQNHMRCRGACHQPCYIGHESMIVHVPFHTPREKNEGRPQSGMLPAGGWTSTQCHGLQFDNLCETTEVPDLDPSEFFS